jgi:outer membrane protein insertion porin family
LRFDNIQVVGNDRMADQDILDLCAIGNKKTFDDAALQGLVECLAQSGRFKDVSLRSEGKDLIIEVAEAPVYTGFFDISASVDTDRGLSGRIEIRDLNLFDRGIDGGLILDVAREEQNASATLANPDFLDRKWRAGIALSYNNANYDDQSFSYRLAVLSPFLTVPLDERQSLTFRAGWQADEIYNLAETTSPILQAEAGERSAAFAAIDYAAVFLPSALPQSRFELEASQEFSGLGEDYAFSSTRVRVGAATAAIPKRLNVSFNLEGGHVQGDGPDGPRVTDRFQLGGDKLRGFAPRGIGPFDGGDHLGGTSYAVASIETQSPLWTLGSTQIEGGFFADVGSVWGLDNRAGFVNPVNDERELRSSAGVSLTATIGDVPVTMYYAQPLESVATDELQSFGLSLTSKF